MSIDHAPARLLAGLWDHPLCQGAGDRPEKGACLLEAVSWIAHGCMSDAPPCVCPLIREYAVSLNDSLPHAPRQRLRERLLLLNGTRDRDAEAERAHALLLYLCRELLPIALRASGFEAAASAVASAPGASEAIEIAACSGWDGHGIGYLHMALCDRALQPEHSVAHSSLAMMCLLEQVEHAGHDAAIAGLDAMLAIGRRAPPPDAARVAAAAESFARARHAALSGAAA